MPEWAVYIALHLPDDAARVTTALPKHQLPTSHHASCVLDCSCEWLAELRLPCNRPQARTVDALLARHAPDWAADASKREFLTHRLGIPAPCLAAALAAWVAMRGTPGDCLAHLAQAGPAELAEARTVAAAEVRSWFTIEGCLDFWGASSPSGLNSLLLPHLWPQPNVLHQ